MELMDEGWRSDYGGPSSSRWAPWLYRRLPGVARVLCLAGLALTLVASPVSAQTAPAPQLPRPLNPVLSATSGSCGTLFAPCAAVSRLAMFFWFSGQYLGMGGDPHASTLGGSVDVAMEVANRVAVSASIPGALRKVTGRLTEELWGVGGPLEVRARVRLGPASHAFYSVEHRPLWSSVIELRTQFLLPQFEGDPKYVGRVQRGSVQPAIYGAGELNFWRLQLAPGAGILVGDRQAHLDLSLRASVQLMDRVFGDVEVLRRQALAIPDEPGRCQSAWMGAVGLRWQWRRGVFMTARYVGGRGDCVPEHAVLLNLGLAFGEGFMRIPTAEELGFIKTWHARLLGMIDPILDCQGIMRADDGTPMFRFGSPDVSNPNIIWRNNVPYPVGEHFWEKGGKLYRDTDFTKPVLDLYGETPLTWAERAAIHECPTLPGLGSPCQVALNLQSLKRKVEQGGALQAVLTEDAQIVACLNHLSPLKAAAVFAGLQAALGPNLSQMPQVAGWHSPALKSATPPGGLDSPTAATRKPAVPQQATPPIHSTVASHIQRPFVPLPPARKSKPALARRSPAVPFRIPMPDWPEGKPEPAPAETSEPSSATSASGVKPAVPPVASTAQELRQVPVTPSIVASQPERAPVQLQTPRPQPSSPAELTAQAPPSPPNQPRERNNPNNALAESSRHSPPTVKPASEPEPSRPLCGTTCQLTLGAVTTVAVGVAVVGGEVAKDVTLGVAASQGKSALLGIAGGAIAGTVAVHTTGEQPAPSTPTTAGSQAEATKPEPPPADSAAPERTDVKAQGRNVSGRFPEKASPSEVLYRSDSNGRVTHYQTYDEQGLPIKRVDLVGATHGTVETPHVVEFERHMNPRTGQTFITKGSSVRPAQPWEIPPESAQ